MPSKFDQELGKKVRSIRRRFPNLTQDRMGELLDIDPRNYRKYESGEVSISMERLEQISKLFKMKLDDIITYEEDRLVLNNTFNNQKGNGILVQPSLSSGEKDIYERWIADKNDQIKHLEEDNKVLRQEKRQMEDQVLFLKEQLRLSGVKP